MPCCSCWCRNSSIQNGWVWLCVTYGHVMFCKAPRASSQRGKANSDQKWNWQDREYTDNSTPGVIKESIMRDDFTEGLQGRIIQNLREIYSPIMMKHLWNPKNWGIMNAVNSHAKIIGPCGNTMRISLKVEDKRIMKCTFDTDGCCANIICGSIATEMVKDRIIKEEKKITQVEFYCTAEVCLKPTTTAPCSLPIHYSTRLMTMRGPKMNHRELYGRMQCYQIRRWHVVW